MEARNEKRRSVVASGKTVEDAVANGLTMLGVRRGEVDIEVVNEGSRGVLGFGAENARVRLLVKLPPQPRPKAQPQLPRRAAEIEAKPEPRPQIEPEEEASPEPPPAMPSELTAEQVGREILTDILRLMGVRARVELESSPELAEEGQPPPTVLNISGDDLGILIGRRGETLRTLQYLVRLMVSHRVKHWTDLIVDVEHYRVRRRRALDSLAKRVAEQVAREGRGQALEPMPAYERRLIHIALRDHPTVTTQSVGAGERRKVMIIPRQ